jgi:hypothetical protein
MTRRCLRLPASLVAFVLATSAGAQQSASFSLLEYVFNSGGNPASGVVLQSASYVITLDSIGEGIIASSVSSASYAMGVGFVSAYPPPREIQNLRFSTHVDFDWFPDPSGGVYNVYRDSLSTLPGTFGVCFPPSAIGAAATDASDPAEGTGHFYLVTARNLLGEEGTKGNSSSGVPRANPGPCP